MRLLICIDDTDNLDSKGTGSIADEMCEIIEQKGFGKTTFVTRHQLLLHNDIPYTSHNSSMCFEAQINPKRYEELTHTLFNHIKQEAAQGSDPGIAIMEIDGVDGETLLDFGIKAKRMVLTKEYAYKTAEKLGVYLKEAGGTGLGVIGALAGCGLRFGGNDGEVKGPHNQFATGEIYTVNHLLRSPKINGVLDENLQSLPNDDLVKITWKPKPVLVKGQGVLIVIPSGEEGVWQTFDKAEMRRFGDERIYKSICDKYNADVEEEMVEAGERSCLNCRYRRWIEKGFVCIYK